MLQREIIPYEKNAENPGALICVNVPLKMVYDEKNEVSSSSYFYIFKIVRFSICKSLKKAPCFLLSRIPNTEKKQVKKKIKNLQKQKILDLQALRPHAKAPFIIEKI